MPCIVDTRLSALDVSEQRELRELLAAARGRKFGTDRFVSDEGDTMAWFLMLFVCAVAGMVAFLVNFGVAGIEVQLRYLATDPIGAMQPPIGLGLVAALIVTPWTIIHFLRVHGRHGWFATSFGIVRMRGDKLRVLRYRDITSGRREQGRRFSRLELVARDGGKLATYVPGIMTIVLSHVPHEDAS